MTKIRPIVKEDANRLAEYANNRKIWLNLRDYFPHPYSIDDAYGFIEMINGPSPNKIFAIANEEGFIGIVGIHPLTDIYARIADLGYWLGEPHWGKGHASRAVQLMIDYTWQETQVLRIEAGVFDHNPASMRVLEKCGFYKEAVRKNRLIKDGKLYDEHMYVLLRPES